MSPDPHAGQPLLRKGCDLHEASVAVIMMHGRGGTAEQMLEFAEEFAYEKVCYLAPQAAGNSWYPHRFNEPVERNEPWLSSALGSIEGVLKIISDAGVRNEVTMLLGFSQGACLALEYAARNPQRYAGVIGLSGGVIGTTVGPGSLLQTPVFLGCSDVDPHIPQDRILLSEEIFRQLNGEVTTRLYAGMAHTINRDEITVVKSMIEKALS